MDETSAGSSDARGHDCGSNPTALLAMLSECEHMATLPFLTYYTIIITIHKYAILYIYYYYY